VQGTGTRATWAAAGSRRLRRLAALAVGLAVARGPGAGAATDVGRREAPINRVVLPNGLTVLLVREGKVPLVGMTLQYRVGSRDDPAERPGLSALAAKMMVRTTMHLAEGEYERRLEAAGSYDSKWNTGFDRSTLALTVPAEEIALPLWLWSDQMGFFAQRIDERLIQQQLAALRNERLQKIDSRPAGRVSELASQALYPAGHPYRHAALFLVDGLTSVTPAELRAFVLSHYTPDRATLVLTGDFDSRRALELVVKYFGSLRAGGATARPAAPAPALAGGTRLEVEAGVELPAVTIAWPTPPDYAPGDAELALVAELLVGKRAGWLRWRLVDELGVATDVSAHQRSRELGSEFVITVRAARGHTPAELVAAVDEVLGRLQQHPPDGFSFGGALSGLFLERVGAIEQSVERATIYADCERQGVRAGCVSWWLRPFTTIEPGALSDAVIRWLPLARRVVVETIPTAGAPVAGQLRSVGAGK
jgi:predicted Zn-dependent peptidase